MMKKQWWGVLAVFALGVCLGRGAQTLFPAAATSSNALFVLGQALRAWSLSGPAGNAGAWAVCLALSLPPTVYMAFARRRRRQKSDWLWPLCSLCLFGGLFFLINPGLILRNLSDVGELSFWSDSLRDLPDAFQDSLSSLLASFPMYAALSLLLTCVLLRWAGGLTEKNVLFWMRAMLLLVMLTITLQAGLALGLLRSLPAAALYLIDEIPLVFLLLLLDEARSLLSAMREGPFTAPVAARAARLTHLARRALAATLLCSTARNFLSFAFAGFLADFSLQISLPLTEMLLTCGALLLSQWLTAACRIQRDNDLMI